MPDRGTPDKPWSGSKRAVYRPGPGQFAYMMLLPALPIALGIATIAYGFTIHEEDWGNRIFFGLLMVAFGVVPALWVLGMSVVVDEQSMSKRLFFGLLTRTILRESLRVEIADEQNRGWHYARVDFDSVDDDRPGFSLYPGWVWRSRDVDRLNSIATESELWRRAHPERSVPDWRLGAGSYLWGVWSVSYMCIWGAIVPVLAVYMMWGGGPSLAAFALIESGFVGLGVLVTWSKRYARPKVKEFFATVVLALCLFGFLGMVPEIFVAAGLGNGWGLAVAAAVELAAVLMAGVLTLTQGDRAGESKRSPDYQVIRSRVTRRARRG